MVSRSHRNGGHITPDLYHDYGDLKEAYGTESAQAIIRFRLSHLDELIQVSKDEELLEDGQCRKVETFDVFFDQESFQTASRNLAIYLDEMPDQRTLWRIVGADERKVFAVAVSPLSVADRKAWLGLAVSTDRRRRYCYYSRCHPSLPIRDWRTVAPARPSPKKVCRRLPLALNVVLISSYFSPVHAPSMPFHILSGKL